MHIPVLRLIYLFVVSAAFSISPLLAQSTGYSAKIGIEINNTQLIGDLSVDSNATMARLDLYNESTNDTYSTIIVMQPGRPFHWYSFRPDGGKCNISLSRNSVPLQSQLPSTENSTKLLQYTGADFLLGWISPSENKPCQIKVNATFNASVCPPGSSLREFNGAAARYSGFFLNNSQIPFEVNITSHVLKVANTDPLASLVRFRILNYSAGNPPSATFVPPSNCTQTEPRSSVALSAGNTLMDCFFRGLKYPPDATTVIGIAIEEGLELIGCTMLFSLFVVKSTEMLTCYFEKMYNPGSVVTSCPIQGSCGRCHAVGGGVMAGDDAGAWSAQQPVFYPNCFCTGCGNGAGRACSWSVSCPGSYRPSSCFKSPSAGPACAYCNCCW